MSARKEMFSPFIPKVSVVGRNVLNYCLLSTDRGVGRQSSYLQEVTTNYRYLQPKKGKLFPAEALPSRCGEYSDAPLTVEPREPEGVPKKRLVWCVVATLVRCIISNRLISFFIFHFP